MQYVDENYQIGSRIRSVRESLHMTREVLAEKLEITDTFLGQIERGERSLSIKTLKKIIQYTGVSADFILLGDTSKNETINKITTVLSQNSNITTDFIYHVALYSNDFCKNIIDEIKNM